MPIETLDPNSVTADPPVPEPPPQQPNPTAPAAQKPVDYSALAKQAGAIHSISAPKPPAERDPNTGLTPRNEDALSNLPPNISGTVRMIADGKMPLPSGFALKSPYFQQILGLVQQYDPTFDAVNYNARSSTRKDFTSGKAAAQVNALNTVMGHIDSLSKAADGLHNRSLPAWNSVANLLETAMGDPRVKNFDVTRQAVADELTRVWRQAGGTKADIEGWEKQLASSGSPEQLHSVIAQIGELLTSKLDAMQNQYHQGMNTSDVKMITPKAKEILDRLLTKAGKANAHAESQPQIQQASPVARPRAQDAKGNIVEWDGTAWTPVKK